MGNWGHSVPLLVWMELEVFAQATGPFFGAALLFLPTVRFLLTNPTLGSRILCMEETYMDFMEFHELERQALLVNPFEWWAARVETMVGHSLDGDQASDGYSMDF